MVARQEVTAWRPAIAGVSEVFHARFVDHVYPMHAHAASTTSPTSPGTSPGSSAWVREPTPGSSPGIWAGRGRPRRQAGGR
ncbi:hypothetical protein [Rhizohabitans arisaemae]|uniref:hypothetical protein n=1 Tax=Rhizohabitans arisaemae TaxID=2720610 RepID=UPI0024B143D8|nr:hypothetical protein [Rhizohabitans arisaemae]